MKRDDARSFIKAHIKNRGHQPITVTEQLVRKWWHIINNAVFNGSLKKPLTVTIKKLRKVWAWAQVSCIKGRINIIISSMFETRKLFLLILVHEMVHAWEVQNHSRMGHGKRFFSWENRIKWTTSLSLEKTL